MSPGFIFDFNLGTCTYSEKDVPAISTFKKYKTDNLCPYTIPSMDEIIKEIDYATRCVDKNKFVSNLFECGAIAISNAVDFTNKDEREERYKQIVSAYNLETQQKMSEIFGKIYALLSSCVYDNGTFTDHLGELFMKCKLGNGNKGQFFTPYHVSRFMAAVTLEEKDVISIAQNDGIITINDPCCGAGGLTIAALDVLQNTYNVNYARHCFIDCSDIDLRCVHMAYLQLSLAGVPAIIRHQNSLTQETWSVWKTPAFILQYMRFMKYDR